MKGRQLFLRRDGGCTEENFRRIRYCMRIWILQECLGFSLVDARIYTRRERPESLGEIAEFFHSDPDSLKARIPSIEWRVSEALKEDPNFFHGYEPVYPRDKVK